MQTPCELIEYPDRTVVSTRTQTPVQNLPTVLGDVYGKIITHLNSLGVQPNGHPFVIYYNMDMANLDIEVGFEVPAGIPGVDNILPGNIPGGKVASLVFIGPYNECSAAYDELSEWIKASGYVATGVAREFYLNDPRTDPPARTRIEMPVI